jgi:phosphomannomutase
MAQHQPLIVSVSGIRGIVGESLTPEVAARFASCYGTMLDRKTVVLSRDGRTTGDLLAQAVSAGLRAVGCPVVDLGIAATPTVGFFLKHIGAGGGVQVSASHNPPEWNGLKLYRREGFVLSASLGKKVAEAYQLGSAKWASWDAVGTLRTESDPHGAHLECVRGLVDVSAIVRRRFKVVLDVNHGSGAMFGPRLLESLGCQVQVLGTPADGRFEHGPEPIEENLKGLCQMVRESGADVGFATDPDADRLAIVDDTGRYIGEEYTLALALMHRCAQQQGPVVINASTSRLSEDVAKQAGCSVVRTPVGEVHVAERMLADSAVMGGEGNGGVIDPRVGMIRDSAVGMALVLDLLTQRNLALSSLVSTMPRYTLIKTKFPAASDRLPVLFDRIAAEFQGAPVDRSDGLRLEWPDAWLQIRSSNTEPIIRVFAESKDPTRAKELCDRVGQMVES